MRVRFPLLLKKRGRRRTGSRRLDRAGELLYHLTFAVFGAIGVWWCLTDVLLPELRLDRAARGFERARCRVVDSRVVSRPGLAEDEYCPELLVEFAPTEGVRALVWTRHGVGRDAPSRAEAEAALGRFTVGEERDCWFDPVDPINPDGVRLSVRRRWWPWMVLSIPVSLSLAGLVGLTGSLTRGQASPEHRSAARLRSAGRLAAFALPSADRVNDSPGVRLAYRLPMDGAEGWRVLAMAAVCVLWNALAGVFVYQLASGYLSLGGRVGLAALAVAPLAATGAWLTYSLWRDARTIGGVGVTRVELASHPLHPGDSCRGVLMQSGVLRLRALTISLICEEVAVYRQGTDTRTAIVEVDRLELHRVRRLEVRPGEPFECEFTITVPSDAPTSFASPHNEVRWALDVAVGSPRWPEVRRRYPLCVYPRGVVADPAIDEPHALEAVL
ncbi:MAG: hypothetical protein ACRCT8_17395 [Lacipirellulaceae bacterium]